MIKKSVKKKIVSVGMSLVLLASFCVPSAVTIVKGAEINTTSENTIVQNSSSLSLEEQKYFEEAGEEIASVGVTETGEVTISISDSDLVAILEEAGEDVSVLKSSLLVRGAGVTKVIFSGALSKGNFKVYLSKLTLQALKLSQAAFNVLRGVVAAYAGNYISAAVNAMNAMLKVIKAAQIVHGKVYTISAWKYTGNYNQ